MAQEDTEVSVTLSTEKEYLIYTPKTVSDSGVITAGGFDTVTDWSYSVSPVNHSITNTPFFSFSPSVDTFTASYNADPSLFPLKYIDYVTSSNRTVRTTTWGGIPASSEISLMRERTVSVYVWSLTVTAEGYVGLEFKTATSSYNLLVFANYDINRDILVNEINRRR